MILLSTEVFVPLWSSDKIIGILIIEGLLEFETPGWSDPWEERGMRGCLAEVAEVWSLMHLVWLSLGAHLLSHWLCCCQFSREQKCSTSLSNISFKQYWLPGICGGGKITNNGFRDENNVDRERQIPPTASPGLKKTYKHNGKQNESFSKQKSQGRRKPAMKHEIHKGPSNAFLIPLKSLATSLGHKYMLGPSMRHYF